MNPPIVKSEVKQQIDSRLHQETKSIKNKYGSRYSTTNEKDKSFGGAFSNRSTNGKQSLDGKKSLGSRKSLDSQKKLAMTQRTQSQPELLPKTFNKFKRNTKPRCETP